jgi:hypothetical protein
MQSTYYVVKEQSAEYNEIKMKNIFEGGEEINDHNFLSYDVKRLYDQNTATTFREGIGRLASIREVLVVAKKLERLESIGNKAYYIEALRWLKGDVGLTNWHNVQQIVNIQSISLPIADSFNLYTQQLLQSLQAEATYSQIEVAIKVVPIAKSAPITKKVEEALNAAKNSFDETVSMRVVDLESRINQADIDIRNTVNSTQNAALQSIDQVRNDAYAQIDNRVSGAVSQFKQATALREWGEIYDRDIEELRYKLYGKDTQNVIRRNLSTLRRKFWGLKQVGFKKINWPSLIIKVFWLLLKNTASILDIGTSKLSSIAWRRSMSFITLLIVAGVMVVVPLMSLFGVIHTTMFDPNNPQQWLYKIALWLPAIVIASVGYSFVTKNYRIYCNMLDQYRHRRAVAKTAQGIILNVGSSTENEEVRNAMTVAAATALFEHKITGHLSKKEVESLGVLDVLRTIK